MASSRPSRGSESPFSSGNSAERREGRYPRPQHGTLVCTHTEPPGHPWGWGHCRQGSADGPTARDSQKNARAPWDEPLAMGEPACQASCHGAWPEIPLRAREQGGSRKQAAERLSHGRTHGESQAEMAPGHPSLGAADAPHHLVPACRQQGDTSLVPFSPTGCSCKRRPGISHWLSGCWGQPVRV